MDDLEIKECESDLNLDIPSTDPIDSAIIKYQNHPSIIMINENVSFESRFKFKVVNENDVQWEILNLNSKKPGTFGNIPTKILKDSPEVFNVIWNSELLEKQFP